MEKLIELLNEYDNREKYGIKREMGTDPIGIYGYLSGYGLGFTSKARIISKEYGFIKWLVDNDKIEINNLSLKAFKNIFSGGGFVEVSDLEVLLMLLAISDTPIDDLISYLK